MDATSLKRTPSVGNKGFTLLETIIALTIMVIAFATILMIESNSINASATAKQLNVVAMLAKNKMIDEELKFEGKTFEEVKTEEAGAFETPFEDYRWTTAIKEIEFPNLNFAAGGANSQQGTTDVLETMTKLFTKFLSKSMREVSITVYWKRGEGEQKFTVSTYWVDLNHEFDLTP